ncbi:NAD-binding protein [Halococcus saccharolyticus]|uniref:Potassium channel-like protein n=1 Tax=Halococcus saccharolyticus DSM 5350 TaxID=1227455 RepID=M0QTA8_9EURY|nr:NAD-binding protein [Halococcus saccharolyticus]EMA46255.1 potassium channel-like protein [Halococcus saccharolyticus DSM 5350]
MDSTPLRSYWQRHGGRLTVLLAATVAALSVATGVANIGARSVVGPLGQFVPEWIQRTAGFTGALTGFLLVVSALGLRRRLRVAWYATTILLPMGALQGLLQSSSLSVPLVVLSIVTLPVVLANAARFDRELSVSTSQLAAGAALVATQVYGTVGAYTLREDFTTIDTPIDAFYYTIATASTVGYGDAVPTSQAARLFGISVVLLGASSFALALGTLLGPAIEARFSRALGRMSGGQLELLEDHVLVLGYGDLTEPVVTELTDAAEFLVITPDSEQASALSDRGVDVLTANPSDEEPLQHARIDDARAVVVATDDDAKDALAVLTARDLNDEVYIVAAATDRENVPKLERAGADTVISPASIGGRLLVRSALDRSDVYDAVAQLVEE